MNWLKKIKLGQIIIEEDSPHAEEYTGIGHSEYTFKPETKIKNETDEIWSWQNGKILSVSSPGQMIHDDYWPGTADEDYHGRYDEKDGSKRVSVVPPYDKRIRNIPNPLLTAIRERWGSNVYVYYYNT